MRGGPCKNARTAVPVIRTCSSVDGNASAPHLRFTRSDPTSGAYGSDLVKKQSLWGYTGDDPITFLKITLSEPKSLPRVRDKFLTISSSSRTDIFSYTYL